MKRTSVLVLAGGLLIGCGGRVEPIVAGDDSDSGVDDTSVVGSDGGTPFDTALAVDSGVITRDGGIADSGTVGTDSGVIGSDATIGDTGTVGIDSGTRDSGVVGSDSGVKDSGVVGTDTGIIGSDGGTVGPTPADCDVIAKATCTAATKSCCEAHGDAYDQLACEDVNDNWCTDGADGVSAGKTTYDPSFLSACADAWTKLTTTCSVPLLDYVRIYAPCSQMLNGKTAPGGTCVRSTECYAPPGFSAFCDTAGTATKHCRAYAIVGPGAACNYYGGTIRYCQTGYFCDYGGGPTVCKPATPIGAPCFGVDDTSCGIGNTCKAGACAVGAPFGAACVRDLECASWSCSGSKCTDPNGEVASPLFCNGT